MPKMPGGDDDKDKKEESAESKEEKAEAVIEKDKFSNSHQLIERRGKQKLRRKNRKDNGRKCTTSRRKRERQSGQNTEKRYRIDQKKGFFMIIRTLIVQYNLEPTPEPSDEEEDSEEEEEEEEGFGGMKGEGDPAAS